MEQKSLKVNTIYNAIKTCSAIIFPLITFPYVSRVLMAENLGKINFSSSIISYASLLASLGVSTYAVRECSKIRDDKECFSETASQIFTINVCSTLIAYLLLIITIFVVRPLDNYRSIIMIQSISIMFTTIGADWINNVAEDFKYITLRTLGFNILSIILLFVFVKESDDYIANAIITVIASAGANLLNFFYRRRYCKIKIVSYLNLRKHLKPIIYLFSLQLVQIIYVNSDMTIIGLVRTDSEVGYYSAAVRIYNLIQTLMNSVVFVVLPQLSQAYARKDFKKVNSLLKYGLSFIITLGLPCLVGVNILANEVISLLAGTPYLACIPALRILTVALFWSFLGGFLGNMIMIPSGREKISLYSSVTSAVVNLVLNLIMIPKWGIVAAAFTTAVSMAIGFFFKLPFVDKQICIRPINNLIVGPIVGCIAIVFVGFFFNLFVLHFVVKLVLVMVFSIVVYFCSLIVFKNQLAVDLLETIKCKISKNKNKWIEL